MVGGGGGGVIVPKKNIFLGKKFAGQTIKKSTQRQISITFVNHTCFITVVIGKDP